MYIYKCYRSYYKFVIKYNISRKIHIATILEYDEKKTSRYNTLVRERTKGQHWKKKTEKNEEKMEKKDRIKKRKQREGNKNERTKKINEKRVDTKDRIKKLTASKTSEKFTD